MNITIYLNKEQHDIYKRAKKEIDYKGETSVSKLIIEKLQDELTNLTGGK